MTLTIGFVLGLLVVAGILLSLESISVDIVALGILVALLVGGVLTPREALAGFGNEALVVLGGLFVLTAALKAAGAVEELGRCLEGLTRTRTRLAIPLLLVLVTVVSAFINNTTCTALFLPVAIAAAAKASLPSSRVLMPVAFASILGGTITVVGTSTNVIVRGLLPQYGQRPLGMFELAPVALPIALLGLAYLALARRLLPDRGGNQIDRRYPLLEYLTDVEILAASPLSGKTVREADLRRLYDLNLIAVMRDGAARDAEPHDILAVGDVLVVEGRPEALARVSERQGLRLRARPADGAAWAAPGVRLVEAAVLPRSELVGRTLQEVGFRQRYGANVVALNRHGDAVMERIGRIRLRVGDLLLIVGGPETPDNLASRTGLQVLADRPAPRSRRAAIAVAAVFAGVIALGSSGMLDLPTAVLAGCLAMLASRVLSPQEAYAAVEWRLLVLVAGMLAFGAALDKSGTASLVAGIVADATGELGPRAVLAGFYLLTLLLTQPMSNQAAALVVLPLAMRVAPDVGVDPRAMAITVALAASSSFLTPFEPSCMLVYGPGGYRFADFPRLGAGLTLLAMVITLSMVPWVWPLAEP